jgi:LPS export ABC transporter permease LptF/LPS export ABC transporter permease LptG
MPRLIDRYLLREVVPPFLVGLLLTVFVLLMNQVLLLADLFIDKGVPLLQVLRVLGLLIPSIVVFALPMAVLMGILGGLARLSADSEIVAFRSLGIGPRRLAWPLLVFGLCGFFVTLPLALYIAPRANDAWVRTMTRSVLARVRLDVEPLEFNETLPDMVFLVRDVGRDKVWHDVFAYMAKDPSNPRLVMARSGTIRLFPEQQRAILELTDGHVYAGPPAAPGEDTLTSFERLEEEIDVEGLFPSATYEKRVREKDVGELVRDLKSLEAASPAGKPVSRQIRAHRIEIHKKLALPAACLVFALIGLPLGVMTGRAGRTAGFSIGLVIIVIYYALITAGETMAMDGRLSAFLGMWGPDIVLAAAGAWLFAGLARGSRRNRVWPGRAVRPGAPSPAPAPLASLEAPSPGCASRPIGAPIRFPGLLDRYLSRKFLALLALVLAALSAAVLLVTFFENLGDALDHGKPIGLLAGYVGLKLPEFLAFILPAAVLAAALLALGFLTRTNEATAMKASGISAYRTVLPIIVLASAAGFGAFLVQERVVPASHARAQAVWSAIHDLPARSSSYLNRHWILAGSGDRIYHYDIFEPGTSTLGRLSVFEIDAGRWALARRIFAEKASFEGNDLVYQDGWIRDFTASAGLSFVRTGRGRLAAAGDQGAFEEPWKEPLQMTLRDLRRYAAEVRGMGFPAIRLRAEAAQKIALPFVSLIMALLAIPFGFRMGRKGTLVGVGTSVVIAMAYWGTFAVFRSLGGAGVLTPFLGAWGANILFGLGGLVGLLRLRT